MSDHLFSPSILISTLFIMKLSSTHAYDTLQHHRTIDKNDEIIIHLRGSQMRDELIITQFTLIQSIRSLDMSLLHPLSSLTSQHSIPVSFTHVVWVSYASSYETSLSSMTS